MPPVPGVTPGQAALHEAARLESARVYSTLCREGASVRRQQEITDERHAMRAPRLHVVPSLTHRLRTTIEQRIARGHSDERIAGDLAAPVAQVAQVRAEHDKAAS